MAHVVAILVGLPFDLPPEREGPWSKPWRTGFYKRPVAGPVWLGALNLSGDGQADLENHGGPDKAVNAYPAEHYPYWRERLAALGGWPAEFRSEEEGGGLHPGAFGENFTVAGLVEEHACLGDTFSLGEAVLQISQPRQPCWKLSRRFGIKELAAWVIESGRTGWYFRVLQEGQVCQGQPLTLLERPHPEFTVAAANETMHHQKQDLAAAARLAACPLLSASWRQELCARLEPRRERTPE